MYDNTYAQIVAVPPQPTTAMEVKLVLSNYSATGYYRPLNGSWTVVGTGAYTTHAGIADFNQVAFKTKGGYAGGFDQILLTTDIPEPATLALLATGLLGLLCYAWKKWK